MTIYLAQEHLEDILLFCNKNILEKTRNFQTNFFKNKTKYFNFHKNNNYFNLRWLIYTKQVNIKNELNWAAQNGYLECVKYLHSIGAECDKWTMHLALRCTNNECRMVIDRDVNACKNILKIFKTVLKDEERPEAFKRTKLFLRKNLLIRFSVL
jgi:hypothetical protein